MSGAIFGGEELGVAGLDGSRGRRSATKSQPCEPGAALASTPTFHRPTLTAPVADY